MAKDQTAQYQAIIERDPEFQQFRQEWGANPGFSERTNPQLLGKLNAILGRLFPGGLPKDYKVNPTTGKIAREGYFTRNADWILPAAAGGAIGAFGLAGAFGGGGAAAAAPGYAMPAQVLPPGTALAGSAPAGVLPSTAISGGMTAAPGLAAQTTGVSAAVAPAAATLTSSGFNIWDSLPELIGAGAGIAGTVIQGKAITGAAETQADAAEQALAQEKELYEQQRSDLAPYRNAGQWSIGEMGRLAGMPEGWSLPGSVGPTTTQPTPASALTDVRRVGQEAADASGYSWPGFRGDAAVEAIARSPELQTLRDLRGQEQTRSSFVRIQAPDGEERDVSPEQADYLVSRGARRISG